MKLTPKPFMVGIALFVGLLHIIIGPRYGGPFPLFVHGYLIDILLPFSMFLLAGLIFEALVLAKLPCVRKPKERES